MFSSNDPPIPLLNSISSPKTVTLSAIDLFNATVITQLDRKFILISIPRPAARIIALIDQHAADERYRLERILDGESIPSSLTLSLVKSDLTTLETRKSSLRQWGLEIEIAEETLRIVGISTVLAKEVDSVPWREILTSYTAGAADECPPLLMHLFCSKACRSVASPYPGPFPLCSPVSNAVLFHGKGGLDWLGNHVQ